MLIRPMESCDYSQLTALWSESPGNTMTGADSREDFCRFLDANGEFCFTAENDGEVVGSVMAGSDRRRGYIYHLSVRSSLRNRGTGRLLMSHAEKALRESGIEKVHLFIYKDNPAMEFYRRMGWHERHDIAVMSRVLIGEKHMGTRRDG